jgi:DNA polymerase-3 subunit gamma/tau
VLARKYRPRSFDDLIGQEAMVRTLSNAFETGRIPQAFILTGVRGVGKTTTARILARALNYEDARRRSPGLDLDAERSASTARPSSRAATSTWWKWTPPPTPASTTSARSPMAVKYAPVSAPLQGLHHRRGAHALDGGVQRLSEDARGAAAHVKFIFATTEIRKVPVTVLSRCQRFDLRRVEPTC